MKAISIALLSLLIMPFVSAADKPQCWPGKGAFRRNLPGFTISVFPAKDIVRGCLVTVRTRSGHVVFRGEDFGISIGADNLDINGDGHPDLVIEGYSGGAHCCWTYWIISLGDPPGLIKRIKNERGAEFERARTGKVEIWTLDGGFDYFDGCRTPKLFFQWSFFS